MLYRCYTRNLILPQKGERLGNPDFGTNLHSMIFEPNTPELETKIKEEITEALEEYTGKVGIQLRDIITERKGTDGNISNIINVTIKYSLFGQVDQLTLKLFGGEGPKFASYSTTKPELVGGNNDAQIEWLDMGNTL